MKTFIKRHRGLTPGFPFRGNSGVSVLTAVLALLFFAALAFAVAGIASVGGRGSAAVVESQQAFQIADAGIQLARWGAREDPGWLAGISPEHEFPVGRGSFTLSVESSMALEERELYEEGDEHVPWTEGYLFGDGSQQKNPGHLLLSAETGGAVRTYVTARSIDLSMAESVKIEWSEGGAPSGSLESYLIVSGSAEGSHEDYVRRTRVDGVFDRMESSLDVSGLEGEYYIRVHTRHTHPAQFNSELRVFRVSVSEWAARIDGAVSTGYVPGRDNFRARRVLAVEFPRRAARFEGLHSTETLYVSGSSQIHGYDWEAGEFITDYSVTSNAGIVTGPSPNCFITAGEQTEFAGRELHDVEIPQSLLDMPYTEYGDPGFSGNYTIDSGGNFYMGNWPYMPSATVHSGSYRFNDFDLVSNVELFVDGNVTLYVEGRFYMPGTAGVTLLDGSSLTLYLGAPSGELVVQGNSRLNEGGRPSAVSIFLASDNLIDLFGNVRVNGVIYAPWAPVNIQGSSEFWGDLVADSLQLIGNSRLYRVREADDAGGETPGRATSRELIR